AYRINASFLPGPRHTVEEKLASLQYYELDLTKDAVLEPNCVYLVELCECLKLRKTISAVANPKSSTGRLDVFTRLIADRGSTFDFVPAGYHGKLFIEICPRSFGIRVRQGSRLNQLRFHWKSAKQKRTDNPARVSDHDLKALHDQEGLIAGPAIIRDGLNLTVNLSSISSDNLIGYKAKKYSGVIDVDEVGAQDKRKFWEPIFDQNENALILDPDSFYILASKELIRIPPDYAAEMAPFDPMMGEYRVHYAGFFDPGFGCQGKRPGARAVLEVRSLDIPFNLEDGQVIGRLVFEKMTAEPEALYGQDIGSHYQAQGLKLSKHFR
ncbi:MAG: 2'-deoxycytidine 5'-triphosphate deaminase, partial [Methyloligellaceae bacterium]